jgi:signal transduction histidine kinase
MKLAIFRERPWLGYGLAILVVALSSEIRWLLNPILGDSGPYILFMPGVMIVALLGGLGPGIVASILAGASGMYFWGGEPFSFSYTSLDEPVHATAAVLVGIIISFMSYMVHRARQSERIANAAKDQFIAVLSHELRHPLAPMMAAADSLAASKNLTPENREEVGILRRNIALHTLLVDDLLDATRVTSGKLHLNLQRCDVHEVIQRALDACRCEIERKHLRLVEDLRAECCSINGDALRLQQVFWNLLRNATKFTPEGGSITLRTWNDQDALLISVADTGMGIAPDRVGKLFCPFAQAHDRLSTCLGGLGLGLAICKGVVEGHGGKIGVASEGAGKGATFRVKLPGCLPAQPLAPAAPGRRVLLVDDHPETLRLTARALRQAGYEVLTAQNVATAIAFAQQAVDVLIADMRLGDGSGTQVLDAMKAVSPVRSICLTGLNATEGRMGFDRWITKPVGMAQLQQAIAELLSEA